MPQLSISRRLRRTPFSDGVEAAGVKAYTVYNHMLLPAVFHSVEEDCRHLKSHVQIWDVACERQVEVTGRDAFELVQLITPRNLAKMKEDQCFYIPAVDDRGGMLNDPVALRIEEDRWWISIADSDLLLWMRGLAFGKGLKVDVFEPDVSPLGVQGPKAEQLMARVFGDEVKDIGFFRYKRLAFEGQSFIVSRSGYSKQGGFEIYVEGTAFGMPLWNALMEAGQDLDVRAGGPNFIERVESGLLSYGNDMTRDNTPFECGLGKFCDREDAYIGKAILENEKFNGPQQQIRPIAIPGDPIAPLKQPMPLWQSGKQVGQITSLIWSPDFQTNVSIGMVTRGAWDAGTELSVNVNGENRPAIVQAAFWN